MDSIIPSWENGLGTNKNRIQQKQGSVLQGEARGQLDRAKLYHQPDPGKPRYHRQNILCLKCYHSQISGPPAKSQYPSDWLWSALQLRHPLSWRRTNRIKTHWYHWRIQLSYNINARYLTCENARRHFAILTRERERERERLMKPYLWHFSHLGWPISLAAWSSVLSESWGYLVLCGWSHPQWSSSPVPTLRLTHTHAHTYI